MRTDELISFLKSSPFTTDQAYNQLVNDILSSVSVGELAEPAAQKVVQFFRYQIEAVLLPAIAGLRRDLDAQVEISRQVG